MAGEIGKGFEIVLDEVRRILWVKAWGEWDRSFMRKYKSAFNEKAEVLKQAGEEWSVSVDVSALRSRSDDLQNEFCQHFIAAADLGMKQLVCIRQENASLPPFDRKMLTHYIKSCLFTASEEEALQWLTKTTTTISRKQR